MSLVDVISSAFREVLAPPALSDEQIWKTQNPMELTDELALIDAVPCYMLYCVKYPDDDSLVSDYTINALAEYGRAKNPDDNYLNFKFQCTEEQKIAVAEFLRWAKSGPCVTDNLQIEHALKYWR